MTFLEIAQMLPESSRAEHDRETRRFAERIRLRGPRIRQRLAEERIAALITHYFEGAGAAPEFERESRLDDVANDFAGELLSIRAANLN